jgi:hypothetical protein
MLGQRGVAQRLAAAEDLAHEQMVLAFANIAPTTIHTLGEIDGSASKCEKPSRSRRLRRRDD